MIHTDDRVDLAHDLVSNQSRTRIDDDGLVTLLDQVHVALELIVGDERTDPPHPRADLHCLREIVDLTVHMASMNCRPAHPTVPLGPIPRGNRLDRRRRVVAQSRQRRNRQGPEGLAHVGSSCRRSIRAPRVAPR